MACSASLNTIRYTITRQYDDRYQLTKQFSRTKLDSALSFYRKDLYAHFGCVNAIEFSNEGQLLVSGGDDRRVLVWRVEDAIHGHYKPTAMRAQHISNIFCLGYNSTNTKIFSAGNDDQVIVHDAITGDPTDYFLHEQPVYGLSIDPLNDNVFASACDDGRILIFDIREPGTNESFCMASYPTAFHGVMFNPMEPRLIATANSKEGVGLWDVRKPRQELIRYGGDTSPQSCMSVRFNQRGSHILALRRRLPPVLYHTHSPRVCAQFDHAGYYNSCTMKSCSFAGAQDEYVLSGSDDFNLYMWKIPNMQKSGQWVSSAHMILRGHRSIVNQVRFNPTNNLIASSGVEKIIKFWSPFQLPGSIGDEGSSAEDLDSRKVFTHEEYISLVLQSGQFMSHDYSHQSTQEDPRMMAFFDSLVQREIEGWSSEDSVHSVHSLPLHGSPSEEFALMDQNWSPSTTSSDSDPDAAATAFVRALQEKHLKKNNSTSPTEASSSSNPEPNRITQLIAKKRAQLMRLAKAKMRFDQKEAKKPTKRPTKLKLARFRRKISSPTSTSSSSSSKTAVSDDSDSSNTDDWCFQPGTSNAKFSSRTQKSKPTKLNGLKRPIYTSSDDDESNSDGTRMTFQKNRKRLKSKATSSASSSTTTTKDNYNRCKSKSNPKKQSAPPSNEQPSTSTSVPNHNALQSTPTSPTANFSSAEESSLEDWNKPGLNIRGKKYSATPDSGIDLSASQTNGSTSRPADSDGSEKLPTFTKGSKNRCKRNYRSRVANRAVTDSDSD